jgi:hypothetical protein
MNKNDLLAEVEDILRTASRETVVGRKDDANPWVGRAAAAIRRWNLPQSIHADSAVQQVTAGVASTTIRNGFSMLIVLLNQARADLRMEVGPLSVVVQQGQVFDYFDEVRKVIEPARSDLFFVDPYLDADFVGRYLPHVVTEAKIRSRPRRASTSTAGPHAPAAPPRTTRRRRSS